MLGVHQLEQQRLGKVVLIVAHPRAGEFVTFDGSVIRQLLCEERREKDRRPSPCGQFVPERTRRRIGFRNDGALRGFVRGGSRRG